MLLKRKLRRLCFFGRDIESGRREKKQATTWGKRELFSPRFLRPPAYVQLGIAKELRHGEARESAWLVSNENGHTSL